MSIDKEQIQAEAKRISEGVAMLPVEMFPVDKIIPYANNSKIHDKNHIKRLKDNIQREGLQESLLVEEDGTLVAGHGRLAAIKELGYDEVPVRVMRGYTKAQCALHRVSSNLTVSTKYDSSKQAEELREIQALIGSDTALDELAALSGYSERDIEVLSEDIAALANIDDLTFDDLVEPEQANPKSEDNDGEDDDKPEPIKMVKLSKLFSVDEVTPEQARVIRKFIAIAEIDSPESLTEFCDNYGKAFADVENDNG